jgi:hypothetical protein
MKKIAVISILLGVMIFVSACGGNASPPAAEPAAPAAIAEEPVALPPDTAQEEAQAPSTTTGGTMEHWAPANLFRLHVPSGWNMQEDTDMIENTTVQTFTAPDGNAFVQVLANKVNTSLDHVLKGQVTLDYMKRLYGADLRVASDVLLPDGREKLEWWSDENKTSGTTYFHMGNNYLYYYTVAYKDQYEKDYMATLSDVAESFYQK